MTLNEQITTAINPANYDTSNNLNIDLEGQEPGESTHTFHDQMIMIPGFTWESYISFSAEVWFDFDHGGGNTEPKWTTVEVTSKEITDIEICIDGLLIDKINRSLFGEVKTLIEATTNIKFD